MEVAKNFINNGVKDMKAQTTIFAALAEVNGKKPTKKQLTPHVTELLEYLGTFGFTTALVMDATYFKFLTGLAFESSVGITANCIIEGYEHIVCAPLINPLVAKQRAAKGPLATKAFKIASEIMLGTYEELAPFEFSIYEQLTDIEQMEQCLAYLMQYEELAYDIETTGLNHITSDIITFALAPTETEAYTFVVHSKYIGIDNAANATQLFKTFLENYTGRLIIHNVGFESKFLMSKYVMQSYKDYKGMNKFLASWEFEDTMLLGYALLNSTERVSLSLKDLVKDRYGNYDSDINVKDALNQDIDKLAYYNALDVSATMWLYKKLSNEIEDSQRHFYETEMKTTQKLFTRIMATGLPIDMPSVLAAEKELTTKLEETNNNFYGNFYVKEATENVIAGMVKKYNDTHKVKQVDASFYEDIKFNPNSSKQLQDLLFDTLNYVPIERTKSGAPKTDRATINELMEITTEPEKLEVLEALVSFSEVAIILNTFIRALKDDSIEVAPGIYRLYGNLRVGGTQTFRPTANNPNLLNMPAQGRMGKLIKQCFKPEEGKIIVASDHASLQGRTGGIITNDPALIKIYAEDIDLHMFMCAKYWPDEFESGHPETKEWYDWAKGEYGDLRQRSKGPTFACQFGAAGPKVAKLLKSPVDEGRRVVQAYKDTYPGVARHNKKVIDFALQNGYVELGLGLRLQTPLITKAAKGKINALRDKFREETRQQKVDLQAGREPQPLSVTEDAIQAAENIQGASERSVANATIQFWDHLTLVGLAKIVDRIMEEGYDDDITVHATIYDSLYFEITNDIEIIEWMNRNLIECMTEDFVPNQKIPLVANMDVGTTWADLKELPNNASMSEIKEVLSNFMI